MKTLSRHLMPFALLLCCFPAFSQVDTPQNQSLFSSYPSTVNISDTLLNNIMGYRLNQMAAVDLGNDFVIRGTVVNKISKYGSMNTVAIKATNFSNAIFSVSKIIHADASITYVGKFLNLQYIDGYDLKKNPGGSYSLLKIDTQKVLQPCTFTE